MSEAPIHSVTVLEDRAYVTRLLSVELSKGSHTLKIGEVTPILADKTLSLEIHSGPSDLFRVREVRVKRERRDQPNDAQKEALQKLSLEKARLESRQEALRNSRSEVRNLLSQYLGELGEDVSWGGRREESWDGQLQSLRDQQRRLNESLEKLHLEREKLEEKLAEQLGENQGQAPPALELTASLEALVEVEQDFQGELAFRYCVPGACWRPYHRVESREDQLSFITQATVWQNTLEDWSGVELKLSTERSAKTTSLPRMNEDLLTLVDRERQVVLETREESVQRLDGEAAPIIPLVPGIDDGGDPFHLSCPQTLDLPSHGKPIRTEVFRSESSCRFQLLAKPELLCQVVRQSQQRNTSEHPLLAGPVDLIHNGALLGSTWLDFVAPGERFDLTWGPDPDISLRRRSESKEEKERLLKGWVTKNHTVNLYLSNLSGQEKSLKITERVPVSESEDLKVEFDTEASYGKARPDENGFVTWDLTLEAGRRLKLEMRYQMRRRKKASYA